MRRSRIVLAAFVVGLLITAVLALTDDEPRYELGHGDYVPNHAVGFEAVDNLPTMAPGVATTTSRRVRAASVFVGAAAVAGGSVWDALCECECHGNWSCNTGNGYSGGLQMDADFWLDYGGHEFAPAPWMATREQQIIVAERGRDGYGPHKARGYQPWPRCSRELGLR